MKGLDVGAQENAELIQSGYEAFAKGDMETIAKVFAPDIRWHIGGNNQLTGDYNGQGEVFAFFGRLAEAAQGTFSIEIHDLLASEDHVVVLAKESASRGGKLHVLDEVHVWHIDGGKATEFWGIARDQQATDQLWA